MSRSVYLAGSLSLESEVDCFRLVSEILGPSISRLPDGETGARSYWIGWQANKIASNPALVREVQGSNNSEGNYGGRSKFVLRDSSDASSLRFEDLGYAKAAINSYQAFKELKQEGKILPPTRLQVSLPTPLAVLSAFFTEGAQQMVEPALEEGFLSEIQEMAQAIPHDQLAIQWDVAVEFGILEVGMPFFVGNKKAGIIDRLVRIGNAIPSTIELGFHLCYGNMGLKHFKEPADMSLLVEIANAVHQRTERAVNWVHMPVPIERFDDAYFEPLAALQRPNGLELFLGLVHLEDGLLGTTRRMETASRYVNEFGIASECGMSNRPAGWTERMLNLHREASEVRLFTEVP